MKFIIVGLAQILSPLNLVVTLSLPHFLSKRLNPNGRANNDLIHRDDLLIKHQPRYCGVWRLQ